MRYAQLVIGPAGSGKSTYCAALQKHGVDSGFNINVVNLDPAAKQFNYDLWANIRNLVKLEDVMDAEDLNYGPNGGLVFCMQYLMDPDGLEWFKNELEGDDDDYTLFDCPGLIELYTHMDIMQQFAKQLQDWDFRVCAVFMLDSHYMVDGAKFLTGSFTALSCKVKLELPQVNIISKMDLLSEESKEQLQMYLEPNVQELLASEHSESRFNERYHKLSYALGLVINEFSLVRFIPLDITEEESISNIFHQIGLTIQHGEDTPDSEYEEDNSMYDDSD